MEKGGVTNRWAEVFSGNRRQLSNLFANMSDGFTYNKIITDKDGKPIDYVFLEVNNAFEKMTGLSKRRVVGKRVTDVISGDETKDWIGFYGRVALEGESIVLDSFSKELNKWFSISTYSPRKGFFVALFSDITERKKAEAALLESEQRYRNLMETAPDAIAVHRDGRLLYANSATLKLYHANNFEQLASHNFFSLVPSEDQKLAMERTETVVAGYSVPLREARIITLDGDVVPVEVSSSTTQYKGELAAQTIIRNITERKKAEKEIADLAKFPLENPAVVLRVGQNGIVMFANPSAYDFLKEWQIKVGEHIPKYFRQMVIDALASGNRLEFEANLGSEIFSFLIAPIIAEGYANLYGRRVTKRKKAEEALRQSEEKYRTLFNSIDEGFCIIEMVFDVNGQPIDFRFLEHNPAFKKQTGLHDAKGKLVRSLLPEHEQYWFDVYSKVALTGEPVHFDNEAKALNRWYDGYAFAVGEEKIRKVGILFNDITKHKRLELTLQEYTKDLEKLVEERTKKLELSSSYARNLIEASLDPLVTITVAGKITDVNKATEQATGRSREELIGSDFSDYFTEPEKAKIGYERAFKDGFVRDYPLAIKHKSGKTTDVLYNAAVYRDAAGKIQGVFAAARDITELRKAEKLAEETAKKLKDAERLAAIGATAGMVGHDIRNPLQAITGDLYLAREELAELAESEERNNALEDLCEIEKNIDYINKIVVDLQDFARPLSPRTEETDLKRVADQLLAKNGLPQNIKVKMKFDTEKVVADSSFINRIMYNLITNAVQAMPNGGTLTIHAYKESDNTCITIKDTGVGIPEKVKGKLFTPMFTTKSKGQGFGLSVVKRMVEALGGTVTFKSQECKGTTFKVCLPPRDKRY